jgi:hypothetical protein
MGENKSLLGITLNVLSFNRSTVLRRCSTQAIFSLCLRGRRRRSIALLSQSAYNERLIPPLIAEETLLLAAMGGGREKHRQKGDHISPL